MSTVEASLDYPLTTDNAARAKEELLALLDQDFDELILDCAAVSMMDSAGLATIVAFIKSIQNSNPSAKLVLTNLGTMPRKLFEMTHIEATFAGLEIR